MLICPTKSEIRDEVAFLKKQRKSIGLVPTMGFLHEGHMQLVYLASQICDKVIVSIFVNPTQFGPNEDLDAYPSNLKRDLALLREAGVEAVFTPNSDEMYGPKSNVIVDVPNLSGLYQGAIRPGHFQGVATVVTKLLNIVQPDVAVFGEKDYQQLTLIRNMVQGLDMPVQVVSHPTVREGDGLAMSSRNARLTPEHRAQASALNAALNAAETALLGGTVQSTADLRSCITATLATAGDGQIESIDICDANNLTALNGPIKDACVILLAVRFGDVLLIDQRVITPPQAVKG